MSKFWGLTVNVGKKFKQQVDEPFCISGAALEAVDIAADKAIQLFLQQDQTDFLLCTLSPKQGVFQVPLNVRIGRKETIGFLLKGGSAKSKVHLTGFTLPSSQASDAVPFKGLQKSILVTEPKSEDKQKKRVSIKETEAYGEVEMESSDDEVQPKTISELRNKIFNGDSLHAEDEDDDEDDDDDDDDDDDLDDDDEDSDSALGEDEINELQQLVQKGKYNPKTGGKLAEDEESDDDDDDEEDDEDSDSDDDVQVIKSTSKQDNKAASTPEGKKTKETPSSTPQPQSKKEKKKAGNPDSSVAQTPKTPENKSLNNLKTQSAGHTPMKTFTKGGVLVNDIRAGTGQVAKLGKMVTVYYVGRLKTNNHKFDASESGPGFRFRLGKGEVIRGWDLGVEGMKVGGKRKLVIPAQLAYGKRGAPPDIPPNATLVFEVELKNVS